MREIHLTAELPDEAVDPLEGTFLRDDSYDLLVGQEATAVYRRDGELLLKYLPGEIPLSKAAAAYEELRQVGGDASNRGTAAGVKARKAVRGDGKRSNTTAVDPREARHLNGVGSAIVGAFERSDARFPVCRLTAFNLDHPERFAKAVPFFQEVDRVFAREAPERHQAQMARVRETHPAWVIHGTSFSTVTVNRDFRTAVHKDVGDLREGFGVMTVIRAGDFEGCYLVFPKFRVAVDMRTRGVLLADVHQWHGNTELRGLPGKFQRLSCVLYYRARIAACKSPAEEIEIAKRRRLGDPIWPAGTFERADA